MKAKPRPYPGCQCVFLRVQIVAARVVELAVELAERLVDVALPEPNTPEQPVQPARRKPLPASELPVLNRRALPQHPLRDGQLVARHVDHGHAEVGERELRVARKGLFLGAQALAAPRRVTEDEQVHPVLRLQGDRTARRGQRFRAPAGADEQEPQRGVRARQPCVQLDGAVRVA